LIAAIASAALIVAGALLVGRAVLALSGRREPAALAGPVGLALLLAVAAIVAGPDRAGTIAVVLVAVVACAAVVVLVGRGWWIGPVAGPALAVLLAAAFAALPFIAAGRVGILGVGLVNDDMASHLLLADWIREGFRPEPVLVDQGYPLGPHALVAGIGALLGASSIDVFAGLTMAIPALTALVAYSALDGLRAPARVGAAALVALPYLAAAYLAQEAFKEPIIALFVLCFALLLQRTRSWRDAIALGLLAAGVVYVYSFPGLAWLTGTALVWLAIASLRPRQPSGGGTVSATRGGEIRPTLVVVALAVLVVLVVPELDRLRDFADFRALHPDRANEGGLGNLPAQLSPLEALGIWPTSEFRLSAAASSLPAALFYAGGLLAALALALALPRWLRRHGPAVPAALLAAALLYLAARALGTVYTSAKALAIAAPLIALITLGGLLLSDRRRWPLALGAAFAAAAAFSSFLILRQAPVGPADHAAELAEIRPLVAGEKLLFLGRDNFVLHELRGSKPFTHVRNFYDPYFVEPNFELENVGSKFDFDSVSAATLARFEFVLTTRAAYASGAPPGYERTAETESYVLWRRGDPDRARLPGEDDAAPGRIGGCAGEPRAVATFAAPPVVAPAGAWSATTIRNGDSATVALELGRGRWDVSLRYDSTRPLTLAVAGREAELPANLDYRGIAPPWPAGELSVTGPEPVTFTATVAEPPLAGRLLGADSIAHLGELALTRAGGGTATGGCEGYVDWFAD
jgi:hypothetical protein